jgi:MarR family 2-MHQ and catechol resistance regulon transcriptional repressor
MPVKVKSKHKKITAPHLWTVLMRSHHAVQGVAEASIARTELCLTDFAALEALLHKGPLTITELQSKVLLASGSMTAAVDRLENRGLLVREFCDSDRRARVLVLTPEGKRMAAGCFGKHAKDLEALMAVFSNEENELLYELLKKLGLQAAAVVNSQAISNYPKGKALR